MEFLKCTVACKKQKEETIEIKYKENWIIRANKKYKVRLKP
jgi:hypothetical protein